MDEKDFTSPESSPSKAKDGPARLRKNDSKRSRSMLDLTDAAISQPVQGEAKIPSLQASTDLPSLRQEERPKQAYLSCGV